jgi:hydroxypyruvate isomerase
MAARACYAAGMKRREFLAALAATSVKAQTPPAPPKAKITSSVMLWTLKGTFEQKIECVARAGLQSVELVGEYARWSDAEMARALKLCRSFRLGMDALIATPDWNTRPVSMVDPAERENFLADVRRAITAARKLEIPQIILMSGNTIEGRTHEEQYASLLAGTRRAAELAEQAKLTLIVEPLNSRIDHKGFFLTTCTEGLKLVREVDSPYVKLLFDIYHEQVQEGEVMRTLVEAAPYVAVFHVADSPGRHDPGSGNIHYREVYKAIQKAGFTGYVAMEYLPLKDQTESLIHSIDGFRASLVG